MRQLATILFVTIITLSGCQFQYNEKTQTISLTNTKQETKNDWKEIQPGLEYKEISISTNKDENKNIIITKINPKKFKFTIYENKNKETAKTIEEIHKENHSLLTFNGTFFTEEFIPTGLLISNNKELHPYKKANLLNGIFSIDLDGNIIFLEEEKPTNNPILSFAIQNGPILLDSNREIKILKDTGKQASRTAIGLDKKNNIIVITLKQSVLNFDNSITLYEFAKTLKESDKLKDLQLHSMLNLDGGTSSGLMIDNKYYPEMEKVQNVILVKTK